MEHISTILQRVFKTMSDNFDEDPTPWHDGSKGIYICKYCGENEKPKCHKCAKEG